MHRQKLFLVALSFAWPFIVAAQSNGAVTEIANPGGGTIAYAQLPQQHTLQGAMGKVLQYAHSHFGARPQITQVLRGSDGNSLAVIFTVKSTSQGGQDIDALALVAVSPSGPGIGALLSDQADRFRTTVGPMLKRLQSGTGLAAAGASTPAAASASGSGSPAAVTAAKLPTGSGTSAGSPSSGPAAPAAALRQTSFPDGSGSIGLPDGWTIAGAHAGQVIARGPPPAGLNFDWQISALDPNDPRSQNLRRGVSAASFVIIPYGTDGPNTFKSALTQLLQKQHKSVPSIDIVDSQQLSPQETKLVANIGAIDGQGGPTQAFVDIGTAAKNSMGGYLITVYMVSLPQQTAAQNRATVTAIFQSYKPNTTVALGEIHGDVQAAQNFTERTVGIMESNQDAQDRQFQAFDNNLLDRTVIRDADLNGHGTVSNDLANALVEANPNRFQEVPPSEYVKGIDY
jgi:hypothetical protein